MMSSEMVIRTFVRHPKMANVIAQVPEAEQLEFSRKGLTIGGMMIFPMGRVDGKHSINQARGTHPRIADRFVLTLECIRRYYEGTETSPLSAVLERYAFFFDLFKDFRGYADFFLLQDLVSDDYSGIRFFTPFEGFSASPLPRNVEEYSSYRALTLKFLDGRNARILAANHKAR
jgi:hypothetical protein